MDRGWIRLHRQLRQHWLWAVNRRYTNLEAWLDLILSANHKSAAVIIGFKLIPVERGQYLTSQVKLAKRWRWHRQTVAKYLELLKTDGMIDTGTSNQTNTGYTIINIQNYDKYQDFSASITDSQTDSERQKNQQPSGSRAALTIMKRMKRMKICLYYSNKPGPFTRKDPGVTPKKLHSKPGAPPSAAAPIPSK
jgi:hypothetical protein